MNLRKIKSKNNFSWTKKENTSPPTVSLSKIVADIRELQKLVSMSLHHLDKEDLSNLKYDINYLKNKISDDILKKNVPDNVINDYENLIEMVKEKLSEIDKKMLF